MFKFVIGEEVSLKAMTTPWPRLPIQHPPLPQKMVIVERHVRECYTNAQITYVCRMFDIDPMSNRAAVARDLYTFTEPELMPWHRAMADYQEAHHQADAAR